MGVARRLLLLAAACAWGFAHAQASFPSEEFASRMREDAQRLARVIRESGVKAE